jgi:hypothetical protein
MRPSRRFHLGLSADLAAELETFARQHGLGLGASIRLLVREALDRQAGQGILAHESPAALAALLAAEHAVLAVASVLPDGERRMREVGERASLAAEERLALFSGEGQR